MFLPFRTVLLNPHSLDRIGINDFVTLGTLGPATGLTGFGLVFDEQIRLGYFTTALRAPPNWRRVAGHGSGM